MKVIHLCLSCFYIDGMSYQENDLVRQHVREGHEVLVVASTETIDAHGNLAYMQPGEYPGTDGANVIRLPYASILPHALRKKLRMHEGVRRILDDFAPDSILFHGACGWEIKTAASYARAHPEVKFFIDSHEDWNNSARNFVSRELLHRRYYGPILRSALDRVEKILCLSTEAIDFVAELYRVDRSMLELYPLGGFPKEGEEYESLRQKRREQLGIADRETLIVQSGKQTVRKKLIETLDAFAAADSASLRLVIAGVLSDDIREEAERRIAADPRVSFIGWQSRDDLDALLCAADVYLQPGTQSATMQHSLCNQCAVILDDCPAHEVYKNRNGWFISDQAGLEAAIRALPEVNLAELKLNSLAVAKRILDYSILAQRVL